ncbi:hypothetical protein GGF38_005680, partial [Coemansia sp. RSA 25]
MTEVVSVIVGHAIVATGAFSFSFILLSEYPAFVELDERLEEWKRNLLMPEDLRDDATAAADITYFGNADHRRFMMR